MFVLNACGKTLDIDYERYTLDNGLEVILIPRPLSAMVSVQLYYRAGGINETPENLGISHLLEHMMFKSTKNLNAGDYSTQVKSRGGYDNAYTTYDYTSYYNVLPADALETGIRLEAERMANLKLDKTELESERQVVMEERHNRYHNSPWGYLWEKANEVFFQDHPYGRPIIGYDQTIKAITLLDLENYYRTYYSPRQAVLLLAGNIDVQHAKELISRHFAPLTNPRPAPEAPHVSQKQASHPPFTVFEKDVQTPYVLSFVPLPDFDSPLHPGLMVLENVLFTGQNALLTKELVQKQKLCYSIAGGIYLRKYPSAFLLQFIPAPGVAPETVINAVKAQLDKLPSEPQLAKLLEKSKLFTVTEFYKTLQEMKGITETLGWSAMLKEPDFILHLYEQVQNLNTEQFHVALDYLRSKPLTTFVLSPLKK